MVNKTIDEKRPIFIGIAQSVTKLLDKMERNIITMRGIQYNETFVDFLVRCAYNYSEPIICTKDQTKIEEMIEVDHHHTRFVGCIQTQQTSISYSMTIDELHQ
ncbi:7903_t:CDS:2, partial [Scutellospora calospora]